MGRTKFSEHKIAEFANSCKTKQEMKTRFPKEYAAAKRMGILNDPMFSHMPNRLKNGLSSKWSRKEDIFKEALRYKNRKAFFNGNQSCYNAAKKHGWFEEACSHMPQNICVGGKPSTFKWDKKAVSIEASKYDNKTDFRVRSTGAWDAAVKNKWVEEVCAHMAKTYRKNLTVEQLIEIFSSCQTKKQAKKKDPSAYVKVLRDKLQDTVFPHLPKRIDKKGKNSPFYKWTDEELKTLASKYNSKNDFSKQNPQAYQAIYKRNFFLEACSHMKESVCVSFDESVLMNIVKNIFPKAHRLRDMKVKIDDKPHIKGFDIDIYVPEVRKGIEFDGKYHHSLEGLRRGRPNWPEEDLKIYHELKDQWFASKGIKILHIREEDWLENKEQCIEKCIKFLGGSNGL